MTNFWQTLTKPFTVLAPMDDVTDVIFREIVNETARPDVFFTEFANADGLCSAGKDKVMQKLQLTENQHPVVAQIWGTNPKTMKKAAKIVQDLGFDGVDINMGCPVRDVTKKGAGAALCQTPELAKRLIEAVRDGAPKIPVSVKTRIGMKKVITEEWIGFLLEQKLDALTVHGRTAAEESKVPAHWDEIGKAVELRDSIASLQNDMHRTILIGNGDIKSMDEVQQMHEKYHVDGVMIGRGIFQNPWVFEQKSMNNTQKTISREHTREEYIDLLMKHLNLYESYWGDTKNFAIMKKFFKMYVNGFPGASETRAKLMQSGDYEEVKKLLSAL